MIWVQQSIFFAQNVALLDDEFIIKNVEQKIHTNFVNNVQLGMKLGYNHLQ